MSIYSVSPEKEAALQARMRDLGIRPEDLVEKFVRSGGHGGQNVNKTSTCVYLKHIPTGIEVKWMTERNQSLNRFFARRELVTRMESFAGKLTHEELKARKIRRQKSKRQKRAKMKYHQTD